MLFSYNPIDRPSLAEIMSHEWCSGQTPTDEEIENEMNRRNAIIAEINSHLTSDIPSEVPDPSALSEHAVSRGLDDNLLEEDEFEKNEESKAESQDRWLQIYVPELKRTTEFFSTSPPDCLFDTLIVFISKVTTTYTVVKEEYAVTAKILKDDSITSIVVNILKVEDQEKYCVEAYKTDGDGFLFIDVYSKLKMFFGGHVNTTFTES